MILRWLIKLIISLLILSSLAGASVFASFWYLEGEFDKKADRAEDIKVEILRGSSLKTIADTLYKNKVISSSLLFRAGVMIKGDSTKLKAGYYLIPNDASLRDIMNIISAGKEHLMQITLAEGLTSEQIIKLINENDKLTGEMISQIPEEGTLMPDTYRFKEGDNRAEILYKAQSAWQEYINSINFEFKKDFPLKNMKEVINLASIVEKETGIASERNRVAAVFINRLKKSMRLQSDPTIIYGLVGGKGKLGHPLLRSEMKKKTKYNTYQIDGLPPTPICNPGRASIEAVLNPADSDDIFFVADGTGGHAFAVTLDEHNKNVQKWREIERERAKANKEKQNKSEDNQQIDETKLVIEEKTEPAELELRLKSLPSPE